jgi:hypothetical protein
VCWLLKKIIGGLIVRLDSLTNLAGVYPFRCRQERLSLKVKKIKSLTLRTCFTYLKNLNELKKNLYNYFKRGNLDILKRNEVLLFFVANYFRLKQGENSLTKVLPGGSGTDND